MPAEHVAVCRSVGNEPPSLPSVSSPPPLPSGKRRVAGVGIPPQWEGTPRKRDLRRAPPPADCPLFGARCCPRAASEHRGAGAGPSAPPCQPCLCPGRLGVSETACPAWGARTGPPAPWVPGHGLARLCFPGHGQDRGGVGGGLPRTGFSAATRWTGARREKLAGAGSAARPTAAPRALSPGVPPAPSRVCFQPPRAVRSSPFRPSFSALTKADGPAWCGKAAAPCRERCPDRCSPHPLHPETRRVPCTEPRGAAAGRSRPL